MSALTQFVGNTPVGTIIDWPSSAVVPTNWSRGSASFTRTSYTELSALFPAQTIPAGWNNYGVCNTVATSALSAKITGASPGTYTSSSFDFFLQDTSKVTKVTSWFTDTLSYTMTGATAGLGMFKTSGGRHYAFWRPSSPATTVKCAYTDNEGTSWTTVSDALLNGVGAIAAYGIIKGENCDDFAAKMYKTSTNAIATYRTSDPSSGSWTAVNPLVSLSGMSTATCTLLAFAKLGTYYIWKHWSTSDGGAGHSNIFYTWSSGFDGTHNLITYTPGRDFANLASGGALPDCSGFAYNPEQGRCISSDGITIKVWDRDHPYHHSYSAPIGDYKIANSQYTPERIGHADHWPAGVYGTIVDVRYIAPYYVCVLANSGNPWSTVPYWVMISTDGYKWEVESFETGSYYASTSSVTMRSRANYYASIIEGTTTPVKVVIPGGTSGLVVAGASLSTSNSLPYSVALGTICDSVNLIKLPPLPGKIIKVK